MNTEIIKREDIDINKIKSVYLGKPNACMCGCSGNYAYTSTNREYASKDRGYTIRDEEVSDKKVAQRLKRFFSNNDPAEIIDDYIFTKEIDNRQITIYLTK